MRSDTHDTVPLVPVTVIGGFLGAGKTSYLNALIHSGLPSGALLLINDFGDINIDSALIDYQDDRVISLTNGCICCTLGGTLAEQLAEALRFTPLPTAIYIEASGVANPARIADIARLSPKLTLAEVVCLVDASQALANAEHPQIGEAWREQVTSADRLLLNREVETPEHHKQVAALLDALNPDAERIRLTAQDGAYALRPAPSPSRLTVPPRNISAPWRTVTLWPAGAVEIDAVNALLTEYADVLLRAKGFLQCHGYSQLRLLQFSGRQVQWQATLRPPTTPQLVLIGITDTRFDSLCSQLKALTTG